MKKELAQRECIPCKGGIAPLSGGKLIALHQELNNGWQLIDDHHIEKEFSFDDYLDGMDFCSHVALLAESHDHYPDILLCWRKVKVTFWTHKIDGLSESDFILAAKVEKLLHQ